MTALLPNPFQFESALTSRADQLTACVDHAAVLSIREAQRTIALPADVVAELEAALAEIVAGVAAASALPPVFLRDPSPEYLAASSNHIALRSFASNSTLNFPSSVKV